MAPPWIGDPSALVIVDWSWWLNKSFRLFDLEGMTAGVVGWLCAILAHDPAHVCIALDPGGLTHRHRMQHPTDPEWRYKAGRDPKPEDFYTIASKCTEIAELHSIPALWAEGYEADDVIATVTRKARAAGYRVWIVSRDKDLAGLAEEDASIRGAHPDSGIVCGLYDNHEDKYRGPAQVTADYGVKPSQIADWLAIAGDSGDNVPGVDGLGADKAARLLARYGTLETALTATPPDGAADDIALRAMLRDRDAAKKRGEDVTWQTGEIKRLRAALPASWKALSSAEQQTARNLLTLQWAQRVARFSRDLTALDCDAPVDVPWYDLPIGGYQLTELQARYRSLGFTNKAREVTTFPKAQPWAIGE